VPAPCGAGTGTPDEEPGMLLLTFAQRKPNRSGRFFSEEHLVAVAFADAKVNRSLPHLVIGVSIWQTLNN
jgi:hypothetical protein